MTHPKEDTFPFDYIGGGYFRRRGVAKGTSAEVLHGREAIQWLIERCPVAPEDTAEAEQAATVLAAWYGVFGTMQLSHAQARLEVAEAAVKRLRLEWLPWSLDGLVRGETLLVEVSNSTPHDPADKPVTYQYHVGTVRADATGRIMVVVGNRFYWDYGGRLKRFARIDQLLPEADTGAALNNPAGVS